MVSSVDAFLFFVFFLIPTFKRMEICNREQDIFFSFWLNRILRYIESLKRRGEAHIKIDMYIYTV